MLRIALSPRALWPGSISRIDALILAMAGHTVALQASDILHIRSSHHAELLEHVLHRATVKGTAMFT